MISIQVSAPTANWGLVIGLLGVRLMGKGEKDEGEVRRRQWPQQGSCFSAVKSVPRDLYWAGGLQ